VQLLISHQRIIYRRAEICFGNLAAVCALAGTLVRFVDDAVTIRHIRRGADEKLSIDNHVRDR
jgi:hypothetical protein